MARPIDTSVVVAVERRGHAPDALPPELLGESALLAAITASELLGGVHRATDPDRRARRHAFVEGVLRRVRVAPFDLPTVRIHARLTAELTAAGQPIATHDVQIAATAIAHGYAVPTLNLRDFDRVPGLVVHALDW